ncbi:UDP-N-acetylmuramoyl-L-alanine--D-glutamate ligase [Candidatus Protofrankia datiscae]|uniref:UDP-N-acetylmuramoyl-L-alanine--L-glutamate ligase n=2 Tax=Frankiaceae TaxID=74712 RepID=F8AYB6_9ACTN|nr:UDP-N-acetylmuramoyl-L-alanine--D-glutamate ligase [Candidatus Protofrankia datiscae]
MRPTISWSDLRGRAVGIYGLGREGEANLRACLARGVDPVLVDDAPGRTHVDGRPLLATAAGGFDALTRCDVVVKTPGISRYGETVRALQRRGIPVVGGVGLWLAEADRSKVLCVTGTKGKSTTSAIAGHLLTRLGYRCLVAGNIGLPPHDPQAGSGYDFWIVEISSYQATDLACSPPVVALTSLHPDHLPWHRDDPETYYRDKLSACSQPGAELTVANGDSDLIRAHRHLLGPKVHWVHADDGTTGSADIAGPAVPVGPAGFAGPLGTAGPPGPGTAGPAGAGTAGPAGADAAGDAGDWTRPLGLLGRHNRRNAVIVRACLRALGVPEADDDDALRAAAAGFAGLDSRLKMIGSVGGVSFVDDSLSTNVLPTLAAVDAFDDRRVALIVGGYSRGIDYRPLAVGLRGRTLDTFVLTVPDNGPDIRRQVTQTGAGPHVTVVDTPDLATAVVEGYRWAKPDGVVLLSPAAASFGRFRDYRDRGAAFARAMHNCHTT